MIAGFLLLMTAAFLVSLVVGDYHTSPGAAVRALLGEGSYDTRLIVRDFRLPRALEAVLVGGMLGLSGAIFQAIARNPLVTPDIIGVNSGASLAALAVIVLGAPLGGVPFAAFAGALIAAAIGYGIAYHGTVNRYQVLVVGVGVNALFGAGISYILVTSTQTRVLSGFDWLLGSLAGASWSIVGLLAIGLLALSPLIVSVLGDLDILALDDDTSRSLGMRLQLHQALLVVTATALAALAVCFTGPVGFVGFLSPNLARRLTRASGATTALAAAAAGATLTLLGDLIGQRIDSPLVLPVGVVTSLLGAPYFLWLLRRGTARPVQR
jgi:iron complex transport system permease protein